MGYKLITLLKTRLRTTHEPPSRMLRGIARRTERALSRGEEEVAAGRVAQAVVVEELSVEDALRLHPKP